MKGLDITDIPCLPAGYTSPRILSGAAGGSAVVLGFSGGSDSTALLRLLTDDGFRVIAAHVNHGIRGDEADKDEEHCRRICSGLGIEIETVRADIPAIAAESGEGIEEAARRVRYDFFVSVAEKHGASLVATAHNADDNLETLLLNVTRGCGIRGGGGIPPVRVLCDGLTLVRPILNMTKSEVEDFCRDQGLPFVTDSTNSDVAYSRNRLRHCVLPELRRLNPDAAGAAGRFCASLREDGEYLDSLAENALLAMRGSGHPFRASALRELPAPICIRALASLASDAGASPEYRHLPFMRRLLSDGGAISLPGGIIFRVSAENDSFSFTHEDRTPPKARTDDAFPPITVELSPDGDALVDLPLGLGTFVFGSSAKNCCEVYNLSTIVSLNADKIDGKLVVRSRRAGDVLLSGGMHRKVKKLICDAHLPFSPNVKRSLPVLCDGAGIVWAPGLPCRDGVRADNRISSDRVITAEYIPTGK